MTITLPPSAEYDAAADELRAATADYKHAEALLASTNARLDRARSKVSELFSARMRAAQDRAFSPTPGQSSGWANACEQDEGA